MVVKSMLPIDCIVYTTMASSVYLGHELIIAYGLTQVGRVVAFLALGKPCLFVPENIVT